MARKSEPTPSATRDTFLHMRLSVEDREKLRTLQGAKSNDVSVPSAADVVRWLIREEYERHTPQGETR